MRRVGNLTCATYAILRIWLQLETAKTFMPEVEYVRCATCVSTRGVSSFRDLARRLAVPQLKIDLRARHVYFFPHRWFCSIGVCGKSGEDDMLIDNRDDGQRSGETKTVANFIRYQWKGVVSPIKICEAFKGHLCRPIRH